MEGFRRRAPLVQKAVARPRYRLAEPRVRGEACLGEINGRFEHARERHCPEVAEHNEPGADMSGHGGWQQAVVGNEADALLTEPVEGQPSRRGSLSGHGHRPSLEMDDHRALAAEAVLMRLEHGKAERDRRRCVYGVAAVTQHVVTHHGGEVVTGCHGVRAGAEVGTGNVFRHAILVSPPRRRILHEASLIAR